MSGKVNFEEMVKDILNGDVLITCTTGPQCEKIEKALAEHVNIIHTYDFTNRVQPRYAEGKKTSAYFKGGFFNEDGSNSPYIILDGSGTYGRQTLTWSGACKIYNEREVAKWKVTEDEITDLYLSLFEN